MSARNTLQAQRARSAQRQAKMTARLDRDAIDNDGPAPAPSYFDLPAA